MHFEHMIAELEAERKKQNNLLIAHEWWLEQFDVGQDPKWLATFVHNCYKTC